MLLRGDYCGKEPEQYHACGGWGKTAFKSSAATSTANGP